MGSCYGQISRTSWLEGEEVYLKVIRMISIYAPMFNMMERVLSYPSITPH